jgi:hypothetical protein
MANNEFEHPEQIPSLAQLVNSAHSKFLEKEVVENEFGITDSYTSFHAASDVVRESGVDSAELFFRLSRQTRIIPSELAITEIEEMSWEDFFQNLSGYIVESELAESHPEVVEESARRANRLQ